MTGKIVVKGYQVGKLIDQSGLRTTYSGVHITSSKQVRITTIPVRPGPSMRALCRRAEQSRKLIHPCLVTAKDYGIIQNQQFYYTHTQTVTQTALELLETIRDEKERIFTATRLFLQALETVEYIHNAGTTHRDLHCDQLLVNEKGNLLLDGFINARPRVEARNVIHIVNLPYIAPEQLKGGPADPKTDIYALGIILFKWTTGQLPYENNYAKVEDARQGAVPSPSFCKMNIPPELESVILKALSPRSDRYRHVGQMAQDLQSFYQNRSIRLKIKDFSGILKKLVTFSH